MTILMMSSDHRRIPGLLGFLSPQRLSTHTYVPEHLLNVSLAFYEKLCFEN
uniref:Alternative protein SEPT12 n=1 Tax=Homo sapiens TaxID=9606 RepID=L8E6T3_HUMAN|nr:alternative protein SEPT12 [Homo sapiens]